MTPKADFIKKNAGKGSFVAELPTAGHDSIRPVFAFTHIEISQKNKIFSFRDNRIKTKDYGVLFENLKKMSQKTWREIKAEPLWHMHEVKWLATTKPDGFSHLLEPYKNYPVWQFKAVKEKRIFGFFNSDNVFEIVWLDYDHEIYKDEKFN